MLGEAIEGWKRAPNTSVQAEEPVDMLKFILDMSLEHDADELNDSFDDDERSNDSNNENDVIHNTINPLLKTRFMFWCDILMLFYMPLLYPKICIRVGLKDPSDKFGFYHHCPGSFQRVSLLLLQYLHIYSSVFFYLSTQLLLFLIGNC